MEIDFRLIIENKTRDVITKKIKNDCMNKPFNANQNEAMNSFVDSISDYILTNFVEKLPTNKMKMEFTIRYLQDLEKRIHDKKNKFEW